ncbi:hypothetical protein E4U54_008166 [Claviceps lovelessii]|nr:hypothetical protein E4U54_008166 [Claviceps lovelessii]
MAIQGWTNAVCGQWDMNMQAKPIATYLLTGFLLIALLLPYTGKGSKSDVPLLNPKGFLELSHNRIKREFETGCKDMLLKWFASNPDKAVRLNCDTGTATVLPPKFAVEVRNDERFDLFAFLQDAYHVNLPGFDGFREVCQPAHLVNSVIQTNLTKCLPKVTQAASEESGAAIDEIFGSEADFHPIKLSDAILQTVTRTTSRVFLGEKLCRNDQWLEMAKGHAAGVFTAAYELRLWPKLLRPLVHWFLPKCRAARTQVQTARQLLMPIIAQRRAEKARLEALGKPVPAYNDSIEWFESMSKGRGYDPVGAQLAMSFSSVYTTTDLICQSIINIAQHPEILQPLRDEICSNLGDQGWRNDSLYNLKLLDSVLKETQRLKPIETGLMRSLAITDVKMSDGTMVPRGDVVAVSAHRMWDSEVYQNPDTFDPYRFYRMRQEPGREAMAQLANTSPDQYGFGLGRRACPGRFFATNSAKIALVHILMKYDFQLQDGFVPKSVFRAFGIRFDPGTFIEVKRRNPEIPI